MEFRKALAEALKICGKDASDPLLFYYALCDMTGNDLLLKPQLEAFHHFNKTFNLVEAMAQNPEPRMIGTLLERCMEQPDASEKLCLKWIHTIFEFYYRAKHGERKDTEQILESLEADLFEPELEGLDLPNPKPKQKKPGAKRTPKANAKAPVPAKVAAPPAQAAPGQSIPDDAYVYLDKSSPVIHISKQCPCLCNPTNMTLYWAAYKTARFKDYLRVNNIKRGAQTGADYTKALSHTPPICQICGNFIPQLPCVHPKIRCEAL